MVLTSQKMNISLDRERSREKQLQDVVVVKAIVLNAQGQILVLKKSEDKPGMGYFDLPGGKLEQRDQNHVQAVIREVLEETGLNAENIKLLFNDPLNRETSYQAEKNRNLHIIRYAAITEGDYAITLDPEEHTDFTWIHPKELFQQQNCPDWLKNVDWKNEKMKGIKDSIERAVKLRQQPPQKGSKHDRPGPILVKNDRTL